MKKRKILIHSIFLTLIALSLVGFCLATEHQYRIDAEQDDIFGGSFTVFFCLFLFFPVFSFEIELYRVVRYFALNRERTKKKTVINLISVSFLPVLFLGVFILHCLTFDAHLTLNGLLIGLLISDFLWISLLLIVPLHFLIMRMVTWSWWCSQVEEGSSDDTQNKKEQPS